MMKMFSLIVGVMIDIFLVIVLVQSRNKNSLVYTSLIKGIAYQMIISTNDDIKTITDVKDKLTDEELNNEYVRWKTFVVSLSWIVIVINTLMLVNALKDFL